MNVIFHQKWSDSHVTRNWLWSSPVTMAFLLIRFVIWRNDLVISVITLANKLLGTLYTLLPCCRTWNRITFFFFLNSKDMLSEQWWFSGYYYLFIIRFIISYLLSCRCFVMLYKLFLFLIRWYQYIVGKSCINSVPQTMQSQFSNPRDVTLFFRQLTN